MRRATVFGEITWRGDGIARYRRQSPGNEGKVGQGGGYTNGGVISFANQIDVRVAKMKVDADVRIGLQKFRQNRCDAEYAKRGLADCAMTSLSAASPSKRM